jgi:hypothetical protein
LHYLKSDTLFVDIKYVNLISFLNHCSTAFSQRPELWHIGQCSDRGFLTFSARQWVRETGFMETEMIFLKILATWEAEIGRILVGNQPGQIICETPFSK